MAIYSLTNLKITDAIIDAYNRGVDVEIAAESDNIKDKGFQKLIDAGIFLHQDNNKTSKMHNKFLIIDNSIVWSGSGNYNYYSFYRNYENYIRIDQQKVAKAYTEEFDELKENIKIQNPYKDKYLEIYFSPEDNFKKRLINCIQNSKKSIYFMIFAFSDIDIANALIDAKNRGVEVKGIFDDEWSQKKYSKDEYLKSNNVIIKYDNTNNILHDKVMIIDNNTTITGSYNFTYSANSKNRENSIIIYDKNITDKYIKEFFKIYNLEDL